MHVTQMIQAVDLHADGEPGRVIVGGVLDVPGASMFEKMQYLQAHRDHIRMRMLREPRGYPDHEGILGTIFTGRLVREARVGPYRAVVPTITGHAWITGFAQYVVDPDDPFPEGFTVGDIWGARETIP